MQKNVIDFPWRMAMLLSLAFLILKSSLLRQSDCLQRNLRHELSTDHAYIVRIRPFERRKKSFSFKSFHSASPPMSGRKSICPEKKDERERQGANRGGDDARAVWGSASTAAEQTVY